MPKTKTRGHSIAEPSFCGGDGLMKVQTGYDFALLDEQGEIIALVAWLKLSGTMSSYIYAPSETERDMVPKVSETLGKEVYALQQAERLIPYYSLSQDGILRIDDNRFGRGHSYRVSLDAEGGDGKLRPRTIYHFWGPDSPDSLRITDLDELMALRDLPDTFTVTDAQVFVGKRLDEAGKRALGLSDRVVVWDEQSIVETAAARRSGK